MPNTRVDIPPGAVQTFVLAVTPTVALAPTDVQLSFACSNTAPASVTLGLDTLLLSASSVVIPDLVALAATLNSDGIVTISTAGSGAFAVATVNVGGSGTILVTADTGITNLPVAVALCPTDPVSGNCISPVGSSVTATINAGATPTFAAFVSSSSVVPFNPAANRIFVRFNDAGGVTRGATSVAVKTQGAPASVCTTSGTAASGTRIANAPITAKDVNGTSLTTSTDANGKYSLDVTGLTAPYLLKVDGGGGNVFFSLGGQACSGAAVVNLHPVTDLIVKTWYDVQGQTVDAAFTNPIAATLPTTDAIRTVNSLITKPLEPVLTANGVDLNTFDPIATPFAANGSGFDKVLDSLTVDATAKTIAVTDTTNSITQLTTFTVDRGAATVSSTTAVGTGTSTPVCGGANVTCTVVSTVATTTPAQVVALAGVSATLASFASVVNAKGSALATSGLVGVTGEGSTTVNGVTGLVTFGDFTFKQEPNGSWLLFGNQRFAQIGATAQFEHRFEPPACNGCPEFNDFLFLQASASPGIIASASVKGSDNTQFVLAKNPNIFLDGGVQTDHFDPCPSTGVTSPGGTACSGPGPTVPRPATTIAGTVETFTVTRASDGATEIASVTIKALTTEAINIFGLTGHTLGDARLGQPLTVSWTLPKTFVILSIGVNPGVGATNSQGQTFVCGVDVPDLAPGATSTTFTFPTTCNGLAVTEASVDILVGGVNGEMTTAWWGFQ